MFVKLRGEVSVNSHCFVNSPFFQGLLDHAQVRVSEIFRAKAATRGRKLRFQVLIQKLLMKLDRIKDLTA